MASPGECVAEAAGENPENLAGTAGPPDTDQEPQDVEADADTGEAAVQVDAGPDAEDEVEPVAVMPPRLPEVDSIGEYSGAIDSDSSEEPLDEPHLKYERMGADLALMLAEETATCLTVHPKLMIVGTVRGRVHLFDHLGNRVRPPQQCHSLAVNQLSTDDAGDFVGSCSDDGSVTIVGLYTRDNNHSLTLDTPVKSMALDPQYHRAGGGRRFALGGTRVVLYEKTFLSRLKTTVLYDGGATVQTLRWHGALLAWASGSQVRVYHTDARRLISVILGDAGERPQNYRCHLFWLDGRRLLIGWRNTVQIAVIRDAAASPLDAAAPARCFMEITHIFRTDFIVCGLASSGGGSQLVLLSQHETLDSSGPRARPQVRVIQPLAADYEELSTDELTMRGFQNYTCRQYHLECLAEEGTFFVLAPADLIVARPRDVDDHVEWLLEHEQFEEALKELQVSGAASKRHSLQEVGRKYLDSLLQREQFQLAASLCHSIFGRNASLWEEEVYRFASLRQLKAISGYLPRGDFRLNVTVYEMVLYNFLRIDQEEFLSLVRDWSPSLYHCGAVINAALEQLLHDADNPHLLQALGLLYTHQGRHDKALAVYLKLGHEGVFELVCRHELHGQLAERAAALTRVDVARAIDLLTDRPELVASERVVQELSPEPAVLFGYLCRLHERHPQLSGKYHDQLVRLFSEHRPDQLLGFLRAGGSYSLQAALDVCRTRLLIPETVYLLGRMGSTREALQLIMLQLADITQAIAFCKEHHDLELWDDLIALCLDQPTMLKQLLLNIGTHVDPQRLLRRLQPGVTIPGLRDALVQMLQDYKLNLAMRENCRSVLVDDCFRLHRRLGRRTAAAVSLTPLVGCGVCGARLLHTDPTLASDVLLFQCQHACHQLCLAQQQRRPVCPVCEHKA